MNPANRTRPSPPSSADLNCRPADAPPRRPPCLRMADAEAGRRSAPFSPSRAIDRRNEANAAPNPARAAVSHIPRWRRHRRLRPTSKLSDSSPNIINPMTTTQKPDDYKNLIDLLAVFTEGRQLLASLESTPNEFTETSTPTVRQYSRLQCTISDAEAASTPSPAQPEWFTEKRHVQNALRHVRSRARPSSRLPMKRPRSSVSSTPPLRNTSHRKGSQPRSPRALTDEN